MIDKRKNYILMIDTETAGSIGTPLIYDCGFAVIDKWGNIYETGSYVIDDIFIKRPDLMATAYYANKIPSYWVDIWNKDRTVISFKELRSIIYDVIKRYNISQWCGHNSVFDDRAFSSTMKFTSHGKLQYFFPKNINRWDTMAMADSVICAMPTYEKFCNQNGYLTKHHPNPRLQKNAEVLYRFISNDIDFDEAHTALADVIIETQILVYCYKQHKKMRKM